MKKKALSFFLVLQVLLLAAIPAGAQTTKGSFDPSTMEYRDFTIYFDNNRAQWDGVKATYCFSDYNSDVIQMQDAVLQELDNGLYSFQVTGKGDLEITFSTPDGKKRSDAYLQPSESGSIPNLYTIEPTFSYNAWGDSIIYLGVWMKQSEYSPGMKYSVFLKQCYESLSDQMDYSTPGEIRPESLTQIEQALLEAGPVYGNPDAYTQEQIDEQAYILNNISPDYYNYIYGDINHNDKVDVGDILLLQKYLAHMESLTEFQMQLSQVRGRKETTMRDVLCMQNYLAKNISSFPAEDYSEYPITIYFDNSSYQWNKVYCYYYFPEGDPWPGTRMELTKDNLYKLTIYDYHDAYIMFSNNAGVQFPAQNEEGFYVFSGDTVLFRDGKLVYDYAPAA